MKRLLAIAPDGRLAEAARWRGGRGEEFLLAPRSEYEVLLVDAPPLREDRLDAALPYRVRALYPGPTESTILDHRPLAGDPKRRLVFAADRSALDALKASAGKRPLAAASLMLASAPARARLPELRGSWAGVLWTTVWAEVILFEGGDVRWSRAVSGKTGPDGAPLGAEAQVRVLARALAEVPADAPLVAAYTRDAESEKDALAAVINTALNAASSEPSTSRALLVAPLEELVPRPTAEACAIFRERKPRAALGSRNLARIFTALALVLAAAAPGRLARLREAELSDLKSEYEAAKARSGAVMERAARIDSLSARKRELEAARPPDAYRLLADLARGLGGKVRARSLTLEGASFRLEAEGSDGLAVLKRMRDSGLFESVELRQSVAAPQGGERYAIQGSVRE